MQHCKDLDLGSVYDDADCWGLLSIKHYFSYIMTFTQNLFNISILLKSVSGNLVILYFAGFWWEGTGL